jgi:PKD repeat protein
VFGSEEYDEWVGKGFNDVFAFYVNGHNCALVPSTTDPVSVDSINANKNSAYFVDNTDAHLNTQLDGLTTVLSCSSPVNGGQLNHMKLAIADSGDQDLDSDVLLQAGSLTVNRPPVARLTASPINGEWPLPVTFDGSGSSDPDGPLASWSLDFGDGTPAATGTGSPPSSIPHTYADPGSYTAALTVRDAQGATDTASVPITVSKAATALAASPALLQLQGLRLYLGNLNAKLTRSSTSAPIAGEVVRFFAGSTQVCQATTNSSGVASCGGLLPTGVQVTLSLGYKAVFAGDSRYLGSSATGSLLG